MPERHELGRCIKKYKLWVYTDKAFMQNPNVRLYLRIIYKNNFSYYLILNSSIEIERCFNNIVGKKVTSKLLYN